MFRLLLLLLQLWGKAGGKSPGVDGEGADMSHMHDLSHLATNKGSCYLLLKILSLLGLKFEP